MKKRFAFEVSMAAVFLALFLGVWLWQTPGLIRGRLTPPELEGYLTAVDRQLPLPPAEKAGWIADLRAWGLADDGKPVYMLNLMRYYERLWRYPGAPELTGTPKEANARYEAAATPLLLKSGGYAPFAGTPHGANLFLHEAEADNWTRVLVVRYTSRRAFFELLADPAYADLLPYKLAAQKFGLVPMTAELVTPDLRWLAGAGLLVVYLLVGWVRSARSAGCAKGGVR